MTEQPHPCNYVNFKRAERKDRLEQPLNASAKENIDNPKPCLPIEQPMSKKVTKEYFAEKGCNSKLCRAFVEENKIPEQPNSNAIIFGQVEGCCEMIAKLLDQLIPKTTHVEDCIITHKSWRDNNLKHLQKAFE